MDRTISAEFPFKSKYLEVLGSKIHYVDEGSGDPILFLHGNPTSSYLWRNIIPHLAPFGRCIAPDLIGMGKSDKIESRYRFQDHYAYIEAFIKILALKNVTLVIHDWGSGLGFHYAMENEQNIKGIAFMESIIKPASWSGFPKDFKIGFKLMRTPWVGWFMISVLNVFIKQIMPKTILRSLAAAEQQQYSMPFQTIKSRRPIRQWPCEIPIDGKPADVHNIVMNYSDKLQTSVLPKLLLHANPGGLISNKEVQWCTEHFPNLQTIDIGKGIHYVQEDNPHGIGKAIATWYNTL
jgi:haloalkane dehalogenase